MTFPWEVGSLYSTSNVVASTNGELFRTNRVYRFAHGKLRSQIKQVRLAGWYGLELIQISIKDDRNMVLKFVKT